MVFSHQRRGNGSKEKDLALNTVLLAYELPNFYNHNPLNIHVQ
jgi:hypothetical protein